MTLTAEEVKNYTHEYFEGVLDDPEERNTLIEQAITDIEADVDKWGYPDSTLRLQRRLDNIYFWEHAGLQVFDVAASDNPYNNQRSVLGNGFQSRSMSKGNAKSNGNNKKLWKNDDDSDEKLIDRIESLKAHFNGMHDGNGNHCLDGFPPGFLTLDTQNRDNGNGSAKKDQSLERKLVGKLERKLPAEDWNFLVEFVGSIPRLMSGLGELGVSELPDISELCGKLATFKALPPESWPYQASLLEYRAGNDKNNGIAKLDMHTKPIITGVLRGGNGNRYDPAATHPNHVYKRLCSLGFRSLLENNGYATRLVEKIAPEMLSQIPYLQLGKVTEGTRVQAVLDSISERLYHIKGYCSAEKAGDRDKQVEIINRFIKEKKGNLQDYFHENKDLKRLMSRSDIFRKRNSPITVLEFYNEYHNKALNWFDRTQDTYVKRWIIQEENKWSQDESGRILALEAIADALYTVGGYQAAEKVGDRDKQVEIIYKLITDTKSLTDFSSITDFFRKNDLESMMNNFYDEEGEYGFRKRSSPRALLEFYSQYQKDKDNKSLDWFNRDLPNYVPNWMITENVMWPNDKEGVTFALEAIEDIFYKLVPEYRYASTRDEKVRIIGESIATKKLTKEKLLKYLKGMMNNFIDETGKYGLKKRNSRDALLEFLSEKTNLGLFDETRLLYLDKYGQGRIRLVNKKVPADVTIYATIIENTEMPISARDTAEGIERIFYRQRDDLTTDDINIIADYVSIVRGIEHNDLVSHNMPVVDLIHNALLREIKKYNSVDSHDHILNRKESCLSDLENNIISLCSIILQQIHEYKLRNKTSSPSYSAMVHATMAEAERHRFTTNPYSRQTEEFRRKNNSIPEKERAELINAAESWYAHYFDAANSVEKDSPITCAQYLNFACDAAKQASLLSKKDDNTWKQSAYDTAMDAYDIIEQEMETATNAHEQRHLANFSANCLYKASTMAWIMYESDHNNKTALNDARLSYSKYVNLIEQHQLDRTNVQEVKQRQAILKQYAQVG